VDRIRLDGRLLSMAPSRLGTQFTPREDPGVPFEVQPAQAGGHPVLRVHGELDMNTAPVLEEAVTAALAHSPRLLVIDLSPTGFLDSSGARQIARSARQATRDGVGMQVVCPKANRTVRLVLDLLDLQSLVPVLDSADEVSAEPRP
jgi:anti-sigma B factor antagonist